jgi:hypothetical protein
MPRATRKERRAVANHLGRREVHRRAERLTGRVFELDAEGFGPAAIASSTGLGEPTVRAVLEGRRGEGVLS